MGQFQAYVVQKNSYTYAACSGKFLPVPSKEDADIHGEYYAPPQHIHLYLILAGNTEYNQHKLHDTL